MVTPKDWRIVENADDWMRSQEKRLMHEERRPRVSRASDLLGPGIAPRAVQVLDWNSPNLLFNGFLYSVPGATNAPEPDVDFLGINIATAEGHGLQTLWSHDPPTVNRVMRNYVREMHVHSNSIPAWGPWVCVSGDEDRPITVAPSGEDFAITRAWTNISVSNISVGEVAFFDSTCGEGEVKRSAALTGHPNPLVATALVAPGATGPFAEPGSVVTVQADGGLVNVGDTLVASSVLNAVAMANNTVTDPRFIIGVARTFKAVGATGTVKVLVR